MFSKTAKLLPASRIIQYSAAERCRRGWTSSLFIPGDKATESFSALTPHVDLDSRFRDIDSLGKNLCYRGMNIDLRQLRKDWEQLKTARRYKAELEKERLVAYAKLKGSKDTRSAESMNTQITEIKEKLKIAIKEVWELEKQAIGGGLSLPNDINAETPIADIEKVVHVFGKKPDSGEKSPGHLEVAEKLGLLEYYDSSYYFLKDDAAQFELSISYLFMDKLRACGFVPMSNSDIGKSITVEGVGMDPRDANSVFTLEKDAEMVAPNMRLHLIGGASLASFCAYHAKTLTRSEYLPLRYVTMGRHYNPESHESLPGLFSTWQSSAVETFVVTVDTKTAMEEFNGGLKTAIALYESLGYHFRVEFLPPKSLKQWESLRASFQMFSRHQDCYIEVGSLSLCDDYISKRLLMCVETKQKQPLGFMHVISGTVVSIPRMLGCVLEYDTENFKLPLNVMDQAI